MRYLRIGKDIASKISQAKYCKQNIARYYYKIRNNVNAIM
ncbi:hypothetical protein CGSMWGv55152_05209 [Gardnerella vaginalis 55152]|uniref:Uncharacterized protein n=1 Tax=Gardnerella vaginalis 55152 TaxID=698955 RepID=I4LRD0_GARVA|nr:hypothetical protein CGSMWGv55152_05209 [Gardnerella vaginalis 55152]